MVLLRETSFPRIKLSDRLCPWHESARAAHKAEFHKKLRMWEEKKAQYERETTTTPYFEKRAFIEITELKTKCAYEVGKIIKEPVRYLKNAEVGSQYSDCWCNGIIKEIKDIQQGERKVYPNWELEPKPEYEPFKYSFHNAVWEMQQMIKAVCPSANWEGFWTSYPDRMGYNDTIKEDTGETHLGDAVYRKFGTGYEVKVEGDRLILYKFKIEQFHFYPSVGDVGDAGIGSWNDKGYW